MSFPLLSDMKRDVLARYGILDEKSGLAKRTTFMIDKQGVIRQIVQGKDAIDPSATVAFCSLHK